MRNSLWNAARLIAAIPEASTNQPLAETPWTGERHQVKGNHHTLNIWVRGNLQSGRFLLTVPGSYSGYEYAISKAFSALEEQMAIVYWEQRAAGKMDYYMPVPLTRHKEDLDRVVNLVKAVYSPEALFLAGHDRGAAKAASYLCNSANQEGISGFIAMSAWDLGTDFRSVALPESVPANVPASSKPEWLKPIPVATQPQIDPMHWEAESALFRIHIPVLAMWGRYDGIISEDTARFLIDMLGTADADKQLVVFDKAGHAPHFDQPWTFATEVGRFVERYGN
jgi:pimeloyl-ACP methyl ester carboxylesterase